MTKLLTAADVASVTGRSLISIYRDLEQGRIPGRVKIGGSVRVNSEIFEAFLRGETVTTTQGEA